MLARVTLHTRTARYGAQPPSIGMVSMAAELHTDPVSAARGPLLMSMAEIAELAQHPRVVGIGESGLDYFYDHSPRDTQKTVFRQQMEIAAAHKKPIIIHCRPSDNSTNAWDDTLELIETEWAMKGLGGILHCFTGEWSHARRAMDYGFLISFAGNITFPKAQPIRDMAIQVPLDRMLVETDAPFLAPVPNRGKRNEPAWVAGVAEKLAEIRNLPVDEVASRTTENFHRFFSIAPDMAH